MILNILLNIDKYFSNLFSLKENLLIFNYYLDNLNLSRKNIIIDLSIIFYFKFSFKYLVEFTKINRI